MRKHVLSGVWVAIGVLVGVLLVGIWTPSHAYPEYTSRTGQQCTACHVNPAGGGPRTLRGLLWIAGGRPDEVPPLPGSAQSGEAETVDGAALYGNLDCALCHGTVGEGDTGPALTGTEWPGDELAGIVVDGVGTMKGYGAQALSIAELEALIAYVQSMGRGEVQATVVLQKRLLPAPQFPCGANSTAPIPGSGCGRN